MSGSKNFNKESKLLIPIIAIIAIFLVILFILKKFTNFFNTETPVLDETSKKILKDKNLTEQYYEAIEKEKKLGSGRIIVDGEEYDIIRAGKYAEPLKA